MTSSIESSPSGTGSTLGLDALRVLAIGHRSAPLADLERMALGREARTALKQRLWRKGIESVALCTCHRTELYWHSRSAADDAEAEAALLEAAAGRAPARARFTARSGVAAANHLFRVASGLDSLVLGEAEVLGQVREALETAAGAGRASFTLRPLFRAALRAGGRARTETGIGTGALSIASAAVQLLKRVHADLPACTVVVVGTGVTGVKVARHLRAERVGRLILLNRTVERASQAAAELGGEAGALDELTHWLGRAEAMVAAAQVESPMVTLPALEAALPVRPARTLALIDLSLPRAIDPACADLPGVALNDLSGLEQIVAHNRARREREIPRVETLIRRELGIFAAQARESALRPLLAELRRRAESIRQAELERERGAADGAALDRLTRRIVDRLVEASSQALRRAAPALDPPRPPWGLEGADGDGAG
ncbi:MAG: glutamyl-tRNA reductase [Deltaproteobacteria bacterium]|nr:MAG: glutamyl-tRNA reductase [Deltaproteobacteria bacterium]